VIRACEFDGELTVKQFVAAVGTPPGVEGVEDNEAS
jgi:hypothetical protein